MDDGNGRDWRGALGLAVAGGSLVGLADAVHVAVAGRLGLGLVGIVALVAFSVLVGALLAGLVCAPLVALRRLRGASPEVWVVGGGLVVAAVRLGSGLVVAAGPTGAATGVGVGAGALAVGGALLATLGRQRGWSLAMAGVATLGALGWSVGERHPVTVSRPSSAERPNLLLITVAGARADRYGAYPIDTPAFDRLVAEGTSFAVATASGTPAAQAAADVLELRDPLGSEPAVADGEDAVPTTLARWLGEHGYATAAFLGGAVAVGDDDFQVWDDDQAWPKGIGRALPGLLATAVRGRPASSERRAVDVVDRAQRFLDHTVGTWFIWVHLVDPEPPFTPPAPFDVRYEPAGGAHAAGQRTLGERGLVDPAQGGRLDDLTDPAWATALYDGEVAAVDAQIARLLATLESQGAAGRTLVAMVGTDGVSLTEEAVWFGHGSTLHDGALRVPVALRLPGRVPVGHVVRSPVELGDVGATLLDLLGGPVPSTVVSLRPTMEGTGVARRDARARTDTATALRLPGVLLSWSASGGYRAWRTSETRDTTAWTDETLLQTLERLPHLDARPPPTPAEVERLLAVLRPAATGLADRSAKE